MTEAYAQVQSIVDTVRSGFRARLLLTGASLAVALVLLALVAGSTLDIGLQCGTFGRAVLAAVVLFVLIGSTWRWLVRPLRHHHSDDFFAALCEQRTPSLGNRLINALQLGRRPQPGAQRLVDAIVTDAVAATDELDVGPVVSNPFSRRATVILAAALVVVIAQQWIWGPAARASMMRIVLPTADIAPFTWTRIRLRFEPSGPILAGEPLRVKIETAGRKAAQAEVHWSVGSAPPRTTPADRMPGNDHFTYTFDAVSAGLRFHVTAGDARTRPVSVDVRRRPAIEAMAAVLTPPAYTGLPPRREEPFDGDAFGPVGTRVQITLQANKPLARIDARRSAPTRSAAPGRAIEVRRDADDRTWVLGFTLIANASFRLTLHDVEGYSVEQPRTFTISAQADAPPVIDLYKPGRDLQHQVGASVTFGVVAEDDFGIGHVILIGRRGRSTENLVLHRWAQEKAATHRVELELSRTVEELDLSPGSSLEYWAVAEDRNDVTGPGLAESAHFHITVLSPKLAAALMDANLDDYVRALEALIKLQRTNRAATAALGEAKNLIDVESTIRRQTLHLVAIMRRQSFPAVTLTERLQKLASDPMVSVIGMLERYRDEADAAVAKKLATQSLVVQDRIIAELQDILARLNRQRHVRRALRKMKQEEPVAFTNVQAQLDRLSKDLESFLTDVKTLEEKYEKMPKRDQDELTGEQPVDLTDVEHRFDRWGKWAKDTVDELAKLPTGLTSSSQLTENLNTIFEEIEKKKRGLTKEVATPLEEGAKMLGTEVLEDLEIWMPDKGDSNRWVMEEPEGGAFDVPPLTLPRQLQDMIGDLVEDLDEFDTEADDVTSAWGGNMPQAGWDIMDGPISVFSAQGKTGNQMPNQSEITGMSGGGRRGRSSGQMVGDESRAYEGRPTPARVTHEPYQEGDIKATKQLEPRGATGGGKKTGSGVRGLQGGTPPDYARHMERMEKKQKSLIERSQNLARRFRLSGRPATRVDRAAGHLEQSVDQVRDRRYEDAARQRKLALGELRAAQSGVDRAVTASLARARHLPPDLRRQISAGADNPVPAGYEELVAEYYKRLSSGEE